MEHNDLPMGLRPQAAEEAVLDEYGEPDLFVLRKLEAAAPTTSGIYKYRLALSAALLVKNLVWIPDSLSVLDGYKLQLIWAMLFIVYIIVEPGSLKFEPTSGRRSMVDHLHSNIALLQAHLLHRRLVFVIHQFYVPSGLWTKAALRLVSKNRGIIILERVDTIPRIFRPSFGVASLPHSPSRPRRCSLDPVHNLGTFSGDGT